MPRKNGHQQTRWAPGVVCGFSHKHIACCASRRAALRFPRLFAPRAVSANKRSQKASMVETYGLPPGTFRMIVLRF